MVGARSEVSHSGGMLITGKGMHGWGQVFSIFLYLPVNVAVNLKKIRLKERARKKLWFLFKGRM